MGFITFCMYIAVGALIIAILSTLGDENKPFPYELFPISLGLILVGLSYWHPDWLEGGLFGTASQENTLRIGWALVLFPIEIRALIYIPKMLRGYPNYLPERRILLIWAIALIVLTSIAVFHWDTFVHSPDCFEATGHADRYQSEGW